MILDLLKSRYSVRQFSDKQISREDLNYILEAGRLSPSGGNEQSWLFGVIDDKKTIDTIADNCYNQNWIKGSQLLIVLCTKIVPDEVGGRGIHYLRFPELKEKTEKIDPDIYYSLNIEEHQTKIPGTHMVLAALEKGIVSTWVSKFNVNKISEILSLPDNIMPSEILVFGYPQKEGHHLNKKNIEEITFFNRYK